MLDQGAHLVDLAAWLLGPFADVSGYVDTSFWNMEVEDNAFALFRTPAGQVASLHVSWTQWKNLFSLEVFGRDGYALAEGLGRWYGTERAIIGRRNAEGGSPTEERFEYGGEDESWQQEWADFVVAIQHGESLQGTADEALHTMEWIYRLYAAARSGRSIAASENPWDRPA